MEATAGIRKFNKTERITFRVEPGLRERVEAEARKQDISVGALINRALREALARQLKAEAQP